MEIDLASIRNGGNVFTVAASALNGNAAGAGHMQEQMKQLESVLQGVKEMPVQGLHGGIKELQASVMSFRTSDIC